MKKQIEDLAALIDENELDALLGNKLECITNQQCLKRERYLQCSDNDIRTTLSNYCWDDLTVPTVHCTAGMTQWFLPFITLLGGLNGSYGIITLLG